MRTPLFWAVLAFVSGVGLFISALIVDDRVGDKRAAECKARGGEPVFVSTTRVICFEKGVVKA